jgi:lipoprotein NlpD
MKSIKNIGQFVLVSILLAACGTTTQRAPVEDRNPPKIKDQPTPAPVVPPPVVKQDDSTTQYVVKKGDTLYRIALDKGQSYSDIVAWNNLANPNDIKVGQVLRVAPPDGAVVSPGGVEVRPLATVVPTPSSNNKNGPRADKRPYSDATLAEMQKNDQTNNSNLKDSVKPADKTAEKAPDPVILDEIVWVWPAEGKVVANFDDNKVKGADASSSKGIDISGTMGQDVVSAAAGTVMYAGSGIRGLGNLVIIRHSNNLLSAYAHNKTIVVKEKQIISKGQKIAEMGNSDSDVVKLHFEIRQQGKPVDPLKFLPAR